VVHDRLHFIGGDGVRRREGAWTGGGIPIVTSRHIQRPDWNFKQHDGV
jgi:hypothetical protein